MKLISKNDARLAHELDEDFFYSVPFSRRLSRWVIYTKNFLDKD